MEPGETIIITMKQIFVILLLFIAYTLGAGAVSRHALIIGLGKQMDTSWGRIHGDEDIYYVMQLLTQCGYTDIQTLKNEQATKQHIVDAFIKLASKCKAGDEVYVHYSGHGQLMTDLDGDEALRSTARHAQWDESWIPYDAYMYYCEKDRGEKHLSDDEVSFYLDAIRTKIGKKGKLTVVVDACHSGDATQGEEDECIRGVDATFSIPRTGNEQGAEAVRAEQWLTISACKPYQLCAEMKDLNIGKLTFALYSLGKQMNKMSNSDLQKYLDEFMEMNKGRLAQNPVVSGEK